ncbi:BTB/POZ domain-containing protein [Ditylenchus destructor]|nr:BTB/POZ domain-containing protein [Ditylenchus destructor]
MDDDTNYVIVAEDQFSLRDLDFQPPMSLQTRRSQSCEKCQTDMETNFITVASVTDVKGYVSNFKGKSCGIAGHFVTQNRPFISFFEVKSAVIRAFAKKEDVFEDFNKHWAKDVTFLVKSVPIFGDRNYLAEISPVFDRMFNGKFAEANQQEIELGDIKPDSFNDFLMAIWRKPIMMDDDTNYVIVAKDQLSSHDLDFLPSMSLQTRWSQSCEKCLADMETNFIAEASITDKKGRVFNVKGKSCGKAGHFVTHTFMHNFMVEANSAIVRAFAKTEDVLEDFNQHWAKDVTFLVQSVPIFGDRNYLAGISPVFDRMFNGKFAEANQQEIELGDIKPDSFNDFLMAIWKKPVMPSSANVVELLELADRFDVASLRDNCEKHLKISSKMELVDRLILSQNYRLESLQDFLVNQITAEVWLQWQRSENWLEKIGALNGITVSRITTNLALELDKIHKETERRNIRKAEKRRLNIREANAKSSRRFRD